MSDFRIGDKVVLTAKVPDWHATTPSIGYHRAEATIVNFNRDSEFTVTVRVDDTGEEFNVSPDEIILRYHPKPYVVNPMKTMVGGTHYLDMKIQPLEFCLANNIPFAEGAVIKYVCRWRKKGGVEDLKKARHFIDQLIAHEESSK